jgi:hypothetical protein
VEKTKGSKKTKRAKRAKTLPFFPFLPFLFPSDSNLRVALFEKRFPAVYAGLMAAATARRR